MTRWTGQWLVAAIAGLVSGWLATHALAFLTWGNTLVWLAATVTLGLRRGTRRATTLHLGVYGFVTGLSFMCFGYAGVQPLVTRLIPFAIIGLVCAVGAIAAGFVAQHVRAMSSRRETTR